MENNKKIENNKIKTTFNKIEKLLELDKIKEKWAEYAFTDKAKQQIWDAEPFLSETELGLRLAETTEARLLIENAGNPPLVSFEGIDDLVLVARKGGCLNAEQLENIRVALVAVRRLKDYLNRCKQYVASLPYYDENFDALDDVREMIQLQIRNGRVDDYASKLLRSLRADIEHAELKMREKADAVMKANKECMSDSFSLQLLKIDEENEERRILYSLSGMVADAADTMEQNARMMEKLDFIFSKGKLSLEYGCTKPRINTDRYIRLKDGRHPLMDRDTCVPLQFEIGKGIYGIVITGPNTGGKTVAIKTVALCCMMAQCGLHVPCAEADICMNSNFLCDIGDGQNISENLSTFSAHITNVLDILKKVNKDSLVIMDELGSGTDPAEGMGIAVAILDELKKSGALFLVTTHYPEVKQYAEREEGIVNARMTFDKESLKPLYNLVIGEAGESCAFYIARRLGMPVSMLRRAAKEAYGQGGDKTGRDEKERITQLLLESGLQENSADATDDDIKKEYVPKIQKKKVRVNNQAEADKFVLGDSVMVYPDKKKCAIRWNANSFLTVR